MDVTSLAIGCNGVSPPRSADDSGCFNFTKTSISAKLLCHQSITPALRCPLLTGKEKDKIQMLLQKIVGLKLHLNPCKRLEKGDVLSGNRPLFTMCLWWFGYSCRISDVIKYFVVLCVSQRNSFLYSWGHVARLILLSPIVSRMDLDLSRFSFDGHGQWRRVRRVHLYSLQQLRDRGCIWADGCNPEGWCTLPTVAGRELNIARVTVSF